MRRPLKTSGFLYRLYFLQFHSLLSLCASYFWILKAAKKQVSRTKRENLQKTNEKSAPARAMQNCKAIKTIGFVLSVFIVSWIPSLVVLIVDYVRSSGNCVHHKLAYVVWPWMEAVELTS